MFSHLSQMQNVDAVQLAFSLRSVLNYMYLYVGVSL